MSIIKNMATITLSALAKAMKEIDICMMTTQGARGSINCRPMSNNKDVTYKGDSYFFTYEKTSKVKEIKNDPNVCLNFEGKKDMYISVMGKAELIKDKEVFAEHWVDSLGQWFKDGIDTKGLMMIRVKGKSVKYWQREKQGEIKKF